MQVLQAPKNYKPVPKAHLFLHKLRKINTIDRQIRQKWLKLQQKKVEQQQQVIHEILEIQRLRQIKQFQKEPQQINPTFPNRITKIRSDIIRQQASLRKKLYDEIYFKKNKRDHSPTLISSHSYKKQSLKQNNQYSQMSQMSQIRLKTLQNQRDTSPIMLRRRTKTMQRQLDIINNRYQQQIKALSSQKDRQQLKLYDSQNKMLKKLQGKKFQYLLATNWQPPVDN